MGTELVIPAFIAGLLTFLALAAGIGSSRDIVTFLQKFSRHVSFVGGLFLILIGTLLLTDSFESWTGWIYQLFSIFNYERLLDNL